MGARAGRDGLLSALRAPLSQRGEDAGAVIDLRAAQGERGTVASASLRYFGCVIGGSHPVALAAGLLTSAWDRSAGIHAASPLLAAVAEEVAGEWLPELFDPPRASDGCAAPPFP